MAKTSIDIEVFTFDDRANILRVTFDYQKPQDCKFELLKCSNGSELAEATPFYLNRSEIQPLANFLETTEVHF